MESMNHLLDLFDKQATSVKERLTSLLVTVSDGRVPDKIIMNNLNSDMEILLSKYEKLKSKAQSLIDASEMPEEGSRASAYVEAVNNSRNRMMKLRLEKAEAILRRFLKVKSLISGYENAISPFKTKAAEVLNEISEDDIDNYTLETEASELFLKALDTDNLTGKEGFPILNEISKHYPSQVQWGLIGKNYFVDDSAEPKNEVHQEKKTEDIKTDIDVSKKDDDFTKTEIADDVSENPFSEEVSESKEGRTATAPIDRPDGNNLVEAQPKQKGEPETEPTIIPIASDSVSNILKATNSSKNCQPSANSFKNDIIKLSKSFKNVRDILPLFTNLGVLSREQIYKISICVDFCDESDFERANVDASINELARKGLLASFKYEDVY